jgi:hypothetical protein
MKIIDTTPQIHIRMAGTMVQAAVPLQDMTLGQLLQHLHAECPEFASLRQQGHPLSALELVPFLASASAKDCSDAENASSDDDNSTQGYDKVGGDTDEETPLLPPPTQQEEELTQAQASMLSMWHDPSIMVATLWMLWACTPAKPWILRVHHSRKYVPEPEQVPVSWWGRTSQGLRQTGQAVGSWMHLSFACLARTPQSLIWGCVQVMTLTAQGYSNASSLLNWDVISFQARVLLCVALLRLTWLVVVWSGPGALGGRGGEAGTGIDAAATARVIPASTPSVDRPTCSFPRNRVVEVMFEQIALYLPGSRH